MINSIRKKYEEGIKIFAECGGFMYLSRAIELVNKEVYFMCELVPCTINMTNKLDISKFGYISIAKKDNEDFKIAKGHEFHYSKIKEIENDTRKFKAYKKDGRNWECIFKEKNLYAGYPHLHFFSSVEFLKEILE